MTTSKNNLMEWTINCYLAADPTDYEVKKMFVIEKTWWWNTQ